MHLITCSPRLYAMFSQHFTISSAQMFKILVFFIRSVTSCNSYLCMLCVFACLCLSFTLYYVVYVLFLVALCSQFAYLSVDLLIISTVHTSHKTIWGALLLCFALSSGKMLIFSIRLTSWKNVFLIFSKFFFFMLFFVRVYFFKVLVGISFAFTSSFGFEHQTKFIPTIHIQLCLCNVYVHFMRPSALNVEY